LRLNNIFSLFRTIRTDSTQQQTAKIRIVSGDNFIKNIVWSSSAVLTAAGFAGVGAACVPLPGAARPAAFSGIVAAGTTTFAPLVLSC